MVRAAKPASPSDNRTMRPSPRGRRCSVMKPNTSAATTSTGALATTEKNTRKSDTVAVTVFARQRAATNST